MMQEDMQRHFKIDGSFVNEEQLNFMVEQMSIV